MNTLSSVTRTVRTTFDTVTQLLIAGNHLARAAAERTMVVEEKSTAAAAMSLLTNQHDVARRLQELFHANGDLSPEAVNEGKAFLAQYKADRKLEETPIVVKLFSKDKGEPEQDTTGKPHIPGIR